MSQPPDVIRPVYENCRTKKLSFDYDPAVSVCVGETDGSIEDFTAWLDSQQGERGE